MNKIHEVVELLIVVALVVVCHATRKTPADITPAFNKEEHDSYRELIPAGNTVAVDTLHASWGVHASISHYPLY